MKSKHLLLTLLLALLVPWAAQAQDLADYTFSTGTSEAQWITLSDGLSSIVSAGDDPSSALTDIGFSFPFGDGTYTQFWANANGIFSFSSSPSSSYGSQFNSGNYTANQPKICGITRDMGVPSNGGYVKYELTGTAPNRVLVCEFNLQSTSGSSDTPTVNFQVQLHENDSKVVLVYGAAASPSSFQIGLSQSGSDIWTVNPTEHKATHATTYVSTTYSTWPGANRYYQFERPVWTCFKPINLGVSALSTTSATLTWEESGNATNWVLQYGTDSEFGTYTEEIVSNTPSFDATVTAGDTYYFRVKPDCDTDGSKWSYPFEFTAPCEAVSALSFDKGDLDSYTGSTSGSTNNLPDCWNYINTTTYSSYKGYPIIYNSSSYANSGSNSLRFYSYGYSSYDPQPQYAILPPMEDLAGKQVTLQARGYNASSTFKIGTMSNPMNVNTFNLITEQTGLTTSYQEFEYFIPATCTDNYLVIMIEAASNYNYNGAYIDDIVIATPPTCIKPSNLNLSANSNLDVTFTWESTESQWQVAYSTDATADPNANIVATVDTKSHTEYALEADEDYYFWVRSYCSSTDQSDWVGPRSIHLGYCIPTLTNSSTTYYISNFTTTGGVTNINNSTTGTGASYSNFYDTYSASAYEGQTINFTITIAGGSTHGSAIWVDWNNDFDFNDEGERVHNTTGYGSSPHNGSFTIPAGATLGNHRMRVVTDYNGSNPNNPCSAARGEFEDYKLIITEVPSCLPPTNLNVSRNGNIATLTWEGNGVDFNIDINGTVTNNVTSPYQFTVELSTDYAVKVMANCEGDDTSDWTDPFNFSTPDCWGGHIIEYTLNDSYSGADGWTGSPISAILVKEGCGNVVETLTIENGLTTKSGTLTLCGDYYEFVWQAGQYPGECSFTFTEGGTTIFTKPSDATDGMVLYTLGTLSCPAPSDLTAGTAEARSVALTWTENGEATAWQICLNGDEENLIEVVENVTINEGVVSYTLNGLTPETDYTIKVRANCGEEQSCWSNDDSFSTIVACPVPTNLDVAEETIEEQKAILTWEAGGEETAWNIQLAIYDDATETWSEYVGIKENFNKTTYPIEGLTAGTTYRVQVQAVCGGVYDDMSEWSDYFEFTTVATCVAPTNLAVTPDSETAFGATVTWEGTNDSYILEYSKAITPDSEVNTTYDFENGTQGWTTIDADGHGNAWSRYTSGGYNNSSASMKATYNSSYAHQDYLVSPQIPMGGTFSFYAKKGGSYTDTFRVYLSTTGNTNASDFSIELTDGNVLPTETYELYTYDLSSYSGTGYVAIVYTAPADQLSLYIDDVTVTASIEGEYGDWQTVENATSPYPFDELDPESMYKVRVKGVCGSSQSQYSNVVKFTTLEACPTPTNFILGEVTESTAAFSWTQPTNGVEINEWVVKYRKSGETEYMTLTPNPTTPSATIENLDANAGYEVLIAPACNEEKTLEGEFDTPCAIHTLPYTYGFEDAAEFDCWTMTDCNSSSGIYSSANHSGNKCFYFYYEANSQQCLISPEFNCTTEMGVSFYYKNSSTSYNETFHVGYSTTTKDLDAFEWGDEIFVDKANTSWLVYTNIFPAGTKFVAIKHTSDDAYYLYLDDFTFAEPISLTKEIEPYTGEKDNYYLIASPLAYDVDPTTIEGMTEVDYDLYYFDQTQNLEWRNHKDTEVGGYKLINGKGYLYANNTGKDITFAGVPYVGNGTVTLTKTENAEWSGWNLVGNPFSTTATIERGFYRMNEETGDEIIPGSGEINVMEGVFVEAESNGETMTFTESGVVEVNNDQVMAINLNMDNILLDRAMVYFGGERKLSKFQLNPNHTKVYIPMDDKDYAVVSAGEVGEMPVNFKAEKNGSYTLSFTSQEVSFSYLHLIDNMTGNDVDLLKTPSYTFDATTTDYAQRFRLVFATGSSVNNDNFGFVNAMGNLCIFGIEGEATLQVIDVTGRVISSTQFSGSYESKLNVAPGVYMLRLINGNDVKVQKIVME